MKIPAVYEPGLDPARALDAELAATYVSHTLIGDPIADAAVAELASRPPHDAAAMVEAGMEEGAAAARLAATPAVQRFFENADMQPAWLDTSALGPAIRLFHRNTKLVLAAMVAGALVEGFASTIAVPFFITGRLRDQGVRRLQQNNRHMLELFVPGGLERYGDGWKLSVRIRLIHAKVRHLLGNSQEWDADRWGVPISAAQLGFAITAFSARMLKHMRSLGVRIDDDEAAAFMQVWRYSAYLMGIPETILYEDEAGALHLYELGMILEPAPGEESIALANSLVHSAPLVAGITDPGERRELAKYVHKLSRALIGKSLADALNYPGRHSLGVLTLFKLQNQENSFMSRFAPKYVRRHNLSNFTSMLDASLFEDEGISYRMPDHVYSEESSKW